MLISFVFRWLSYADVVEYFIQPMTLHAPSIIFSVIVHENRGVLNMRVQVTLSCGSKNQPQHSELEFGYFHIRIRYYGLGLSFSRPPSSIWFSGQKKTSHNTYIVLRVPGNLTSNSKVPLLFRKSLTTPVSTRCLYGPTTSGIFICRCYHSHVCLFMPGS